MKLYLLPGRSKESKRKTAVIKDNCNPVFDAEFEYVISMAELHATELEITVATQKGFLIGGHPVIGVVRIPLGGDELGDIRHGAGKSYWLDLLPDSKSD